jgi:nucleolar protein 56
MKTPFGVTDGKTLTRFKKGKEVEEFLSSKEPFPQKPLDLRTLSGASDYNSFMTNFGIAYSKELIKSKDRRDRFIIQQVEAIGDMDKILNLFSERLREWYSLHYPELSAKVDEHSKFAELIAKHGKRDAFPGFKTSFGQELSKEDVDVVRGYAKHTADLYKLRESLIKSLDKSMKRLAPNTTAISGSVIGARLISHTGSLETLAKKSASTIQILGAEKALFRYLKGKGTAPRFGLIYSHPLVQKASEKNKGKVARLLSAKIAIAARLDFYGNEDKGKKLVKELERQVGAIR